MISVGVRGALINVALIAGGESVRSLSPFVRASSCGARCDGVRVPPRVGRILWADAVGAGGVIPAHVTLELSSYLFL